jgi:RHS repeat-associated protein
MSHSFSSVARSLIALLSFIVAVPAAFSQGYIYSSGTPTFTTAEPVELGFLNAGNGNLHLEIPLASFPQRGKVSVSAKLVYDSRIWRVLNNGVTSWWDPNNVTDAAGANSKGGWRFVSTVKSRVSYIVSVDTCDIQSGSMETDYGFSWIAPDGTSHAFPIQTSYSDCNGIVHDFPNASAMASDSSGYYMSVTNYSDAVVYAPDGTQVYPTLQDTNGNNVTTDGSGNAIDTLGRTPVTVTSNGAQTYYDILNSQGGTSRVTVTTGSVSVNTAFAKTGVTEYSGAISAYTSAVLPDGTGYQFGYDSYGGISSVTLPTGSQIGFGYANFTDSYGTKNRWATSRTSGGGTWAYTPQVVTTCATGAQNCQQKVTVTKPSNDYVVYTFTLNGGAWKSQSQSFDAASTLLSTQTHDYDLSQTCTGCTGAGYVRTVRDTMTVPVPGGSSISTKTEYTYDTPQTGNVTSIKEWNYYTGTPSATPDRWTDIAYLTGTNYTAKNIINRPTSITVKTGAGSTVAQTTYGYDSTALTSVTGITHHDDSAFGIGNTVRGNPTTNGGLVSGSTYLTTTLAYDTTGQVRSSTDPKGNVTSFSYTDTFYTDDGANPPETYTATTPTNAYLTQVTLPASGSLTFGYYFNSGKRAVEKDQESQGAYHHFLDSLDRETHVYDRRLSNGTRGWSLTEYAAATQVNIYRSLTSTSAATSCTGCAKRQVSLDGLGRVTRTALLSDPEGATYSDVTYDSTGRVSTATNPYRTTTEPTYGVESVAYDGLGRASTFTHADNNALHSYFGANVASGGGRSSQLCATGTYGIGYPSLTVDEAGKKRQIWGDAFGRTIEVDEPDSSGGLNLATCNRHDLQSNLTQIDQGDRVARTYVYDDLSRPTSVSTPESGTTTFGYTTNGTTLCSGDVAAACWRQDARGSTSKITYTYDGINRLAGKTYADGTAAVSYFYDQTTYNGLTIANGRGKRTGMSDGSGQTAWTYDYAGHVLTERRTISGMTKAISYTYNLDGSVATIAYPSGRTLTYSYSNALRPISAVDSANSVNYALSGTYAPQGALATVLQGRTGTGTGTTLTQTFNNRLQPSTIRATNSTLTVMDLTYSFDLGGGVNNGSVAQITNNRDTSRTQSFTYDELNRIKTAEAPTAWGDQFTYDRYGNLLQKTVTKGTAESLLITADTHNRITSSPWVYDAAGNVTNDSVTGRTYTVNAESRVTSVGGVNFTYDGDSVRVAKSGFRLYWTGGGVEPLAETDFSGIVKKEYIYFAGKRIAFLDVATGNTYFYYSDHLGSSNVMTNGSGATIKEESDFYPFGGERVVVDALDNRYKFTGKEMDPETGNSHFLFREFTTVAGRFLSPDRLGGDVANPQSLNRYTYVLNNPANDIDPLGLWCTDETKTPCMMYWYIRGSHLGVGWNQLDLLSRSIQDPVTHPYIVQNEKFGNIMDWGIMTIYPYASLSQVVFDPMTYFRDVATARRQAYIDKVQKPLDGRKVLQEVGRLSGFAASPCFYAAWGGAAAGVGGGGAVARPALTYLAENWPAIANELSAKAYEQGWDSAETDVVLDGIEHAPAVVAAGASWASANCY